MTHEGSLTESDIASNSTLNTDLFPRIYGPRKLSSNLKILKDDEEEKEDDNRSSIRELRGMFQQSLGGTDVDYDLSDSQNIFRSTFDTESDVSTEDTNEYFLDSSILNEIPMNINGYSDGKGDRLKYLTLYEQLKKQKQRKVRGKVDNGEVNLQANESSSSSIFDLSKLDDFSRFVKQTEINDLIYSKISNLPASSANLLNIVPTKELAEKFYTNNNFENENTKKITKPKLSWYNLDWKKNCQSKSDIEELNFNFASPISSNEEKEPRLLQRKLEVRHLQMISLGGTLGVGLFLNSGKAITMAGGFGTLLAFIICGLIVLATIVSFCEMVTFVSVVDGVSGLSSRFVNDSFGFAIGWLYFASFALGLAGELVASVIMLSYFPDLQILENKGSSAGFVSLFLTFIVVSNLIDVRIFGEIEYFASLIKLIYALIMIIIMIVLNTGGFGNEDIGFKYWQYSKSDFENNLIFGLFRPTFNLQDNGTSSITEGVGGDKGRFMSLLVAILVTSYAYSGTEIVCIAACEAKNPRKALPSATRRVFWRVLIFYCLSAFVVSLNIYSGDPRLLRYYSGNTGVSSNEFYSNIAVKYVGGVKCNGASTVFAGYGSGAQSPWIVALQSAGLCKFSSVVDGFLVFFAISCGNAQLYVSSRTVYSLALQRKAPKFLTYCNKYGIPYNAVLFAASFGLFAYLCVSKEATLVFQNLTSVISSSGIMVWFAMCLSYIRFYFGLKKRPDIIDRDDKSYPYKSPFQPYCAIFGLVGSGIIILCMGYVVFLKDQWDTMFFFSSYGTLMIFVVLYLGYKFIRGTRTPSLEALDFDSGRREMDRYIWDGGREYNVRSFKDLTQKFFSFLA